MNANINHTAELFVSNAQSMRDEFFWHDTMVKRLAALLYTAQGRTVDSESVRAAHDLIKQNTGVFSSFRGNLAICLATLLSLAPSRDRQLSDALEVYGMMKEYKFWASDYLVMAAYQIAATAPHPVQRQAVERTRDFYEGMKAYHWILTGQDDYIFAALLGLSSLDINNGIQKIEQLYQQLKPMFWSGNAVQTLAQILALCGNSGQAVERVLALRDAFRQQDLRLDREYTLSSLGVLAILPAETGTLVREVCDTFQFLRAQKGFGAWSVTKQELLLLSAALVAFTHAHDSQNDILAANLSTTILNIIIAQQTAIAAAAASSAAASSSSH